jgi:glucose-1-phosphate thymidylyltransferase
MSPYWRQINLLLLLRRDRGKKIACIEEIAFRKGWITKENILNMLEKEDNSNYREYLEGLLD